MNRRKFIKSASMIAISSTISMIGIPALASGTPPDPARAGSKLDELIPSINPVLSLKNAHTEEVMTRRFFGPTGYDFDALSDINWMFRDWREDEAPQFDLRVIWALAAIRMAAIKEGHSGDQILLSGFRTQRTNQMLRNRGIGAARNSMHLKAQASDITMEGVSVLHIATYARWLEVGGVGQYNKSGFVHLDSGEARDWTV